MEKKLVGDTLTNLEDFEYNRVVSSARDVYDIVDGKVELVGKVNLLEFVNSNYDAERIRMRELIERGNMSNGIN